MRNIIVVFLSLLIFAPLINSEEQTQAKPRLMVKHAESNMGLEIWTEHNPLWYVERRFIGNRPVFLAQTPPQVYPPASMSVISYAKQKTEKDEFNEVASIAIDNGLSSYGLSEIERQQLSTLHQQYGELEGFEVNFKAKVHGFPSDVKIFIGRKEGKGPVLLQLYTLEGKMEHLTEQIRRSWTNIRYL